MSECFQRVRVSMKAVERAENLGEVEGRKLQTEYSSLLSRQVKLLGELSVAKIRLKGEEFKVNLRRTTAPLVNKRFFLSNISYSLTFGPSISESVPDLPGTRKAMKTTMVVTLHIYCSWHRNRLLKCFVRMTSRLGYQRNQGEKIYVRLGF